MWKDQIYISTSVDMVEMGDDDDNEDLEGGEDSHVKTIKILCSTVESQSAKCLQTDLYNYE